MAYSEEITKLLDEGAREMAAKKYELAVDHYSEACELINLETNKDDPDLLYLYGWALYENAVAASDVLGQRAAKETLEEAKKDVQDNKDGDSEGGRLQFNEQLAEEEDDEEDDEGKTAKTEECISEAADSAERAAEDRTEEEEEAPSSDFEIAWDILDLTRTLLQKESEESEEKDAEIPLLEKGKELADQPRVVQLKKKLSDVYSLLGDISLETENFVQAAADLTSMVSLRQQLYPLASGELTEAFYRQSLALEFTDLPASIDAMKRVMESIDARIATNEKIDDDIIQEMKQRLYDLEKGNKQIKEERDRIMKGILGQLGKAETAEQHPAEEKATASGPVVHDLTSLVKKRKAKPKNVPGKKRRAI